MNKLLHQLSPFSSSPKVTTAMEAFEKLFGQKESVIIGAVHLGGLPGSPRHHKPFQEIIDTALSDAAIYFKHGVDGIVVENSEDIPYQKPPNIGPETTAYMTRVCHELRHKFPKKPMGVAILAGGNAQAIAVASATGMNFIRAEGYVLGSIADEGYLDACAGPLVRFRKLIGAENVMIYADVKKKHSAHAITADLTIQDCAEAAEFFDADAVILTGKGTGKAGDPQEAAVTQKVVKVPVLVGSGVGRNNLHAFLNQCNGVIVGSDFKRDGYWLNEVQEDRVKSFMDEVKKLRKTIVEERKKDERAEGDKPKEDSKQPLSNFIG